MSGIDSLVALMTKPQILRVIGLTSIILVVVVALDYLINVVLTPGATAYTPLVTIGIALLVTPASISYLILQDAKMQTARAALADERVARMAADAANMAKTRFLANMSHELRTPLNAIIGYAEIIEEDATTPAVSADSRRIQGSAHHLLGLITGILDHVKLEAGELRLNVTHTALAPLFDETVSAVRADAAANGNTLSADCAADIGLAWVDAQRLRQCMMCVTENAAKFTSNGRVALRLTTFGDDGLVFEVRDTGIGIAPEALATLFDPFVQVDLSETRRFGGAGIGLALTKQLMDAMGGSVSVESTPGAGSTFTLRWSRGVAPSNVVTLAA